MFFSAASTHLFYAKKSNDPGAKFQAALMIEFQ
jgi:hypothetical protein